jgi:hypothetical protein
MVSKLLKLFPGVVTRIGFGVVLAGALALGLATTALSGPASPAISASLAASTSCGYGGAGCEDKFQAGMTAAQVVPGPGQAGAVGRAQLAGMEETQKMCVGLNIKSVKGPVTGVTVNKGGAKHNGPVVINFGPVTVSSTGTANKCATGVTPTLFEAIEAHPATYYIVVNTKSFPHGAIRGQLAHLT